MPDVPVQMRGKYYNTCGSFKCPNYSRCVMCSGCDNYNFNNFMCKDCESSKPKEMLCKHTDYQQHQFVKVMTMFNKPLSHIDTTPPDSKEAHGKWLKDSEINELEDNLLSKVKQST